ncbi:restriction endonuclease subunit S [Saprospira sp. CCB-QB6]|uniref:restriction endonuclease subunit S n=1 Tax=Saprospira sp. CCB-QB6 TaxID=3023936 RepID=UPI00234B0518|nr:restriction endonuclease subunit S [Saprospira sp. CCB-QB6]WCL80916.1 restriction endonuclease subunit S [Saprospira sp. CCB-QB6]
MKKRDWKKVKLGEVLTKPISGEWGTDPTDRKIGVIRTTNFTNEGKVDLTKGVAYRDIPETKVEKKQLRKRDVIIEKSGGSPKQPVGRVVFFKEEGTYLCNNFTSILRAKNDQKLDQKFLFYYLFYIHKVGLTNLYQNKTTGIINLQLTRYLKEVSIPLPPLPAQKAIAAQLDRADKLRQALAQSLADYDRLLAASFLDMFGDPVLNPKGWEVVKLGELIKKLNAGTSVNSTDTTYSKERKGILKTSCVYSGAFNPLEAKVIKDEELSRAKLNPKAGSIIISRMNTSELVGKSAYIKEDYDNLYLPDRLWMTEKGDKEHSTIWLAKAISMESFMLTLQQIATGTSGSMKNISKKGFLSLSVALPPLPLQQQFAQLVERIERQKALIQSAQQSAEDLFGALLQAYFYEGK